LKAEGPLIDPSYFNIYYFHIYKMRDLSIFIILLIFFSACSDGNREKAEAPPTDTVYITTTEPHRVSPAWTFTGDFDRRFGDYRFEVHSIPQLGYHDSVYIRISTDSLVVMDTIRECCQIEEVHVRDLDADDFPELYILGRSEGSGGFLCFDMFEANGDPISEGDLNKIWGTHRLTLTADQAIHEHWLESNNGNCDYVGMEFSYFELVDNSFKLVKKDEWIHREGEVVNRSEFGK
jgi:hypothetical protein